MEENAIVIYQTDDGQATIEVRLEQETVWLSQAQMVELFGQTKQNISLHINNIYKEGELNKPSTVKESLTVHTALARKTDATGREWLYVEIDEAHFPKNDILFLEQPFPTKVIGWISGRYVKQL